MAGPRRGGQVGGPSVEAFVGQDGEGDGFFRVAVDAELGGRPEPRGVERVPQPPRQLRVPDAAAGGDDLVDAHLRSHEALERPGDGSRYPHGALGGGKVDSSGVFWSFFH